ncbi:Calx-beta domain-containing protein [Sphingomonas aerolata]|uniref:Calx-beta domain-containing protein n=1 Tax=Sphingomonas aerolata TaxID=185951 RepID=UPI002FE10976
MGSQTAAGSSLALSAMLPSSFDAAGYVALTYVEIGQVEKLGSFGASFSKVEFQGLKGAKQKFKGSADFGALQPSIALDALDAGQILLQTASDDETQKLYSFRVTYPDGSTRYFRGRVFGAPETADGADSMLMATPTVEICSKVVKVDAGATIVPAPTLTQPSISPTSGAVGTTFTATDGTVTNGTITGRRWLLGTTAIGTGTTVTPNAAGSLTRENTAVGTNGETITSTSVARTVSAASAPSLSLSSAVSKAEGNSGTTLFSWILTLSRDGSTAAYPFSWATAGNGANPADAADFGGAFPAGSGTFAAGETTKTISVLVAGDTAFEPDDTFTLSVTAAGLNTVTSTGTITNDDAAPSQPTVTLSGAQSKAEGNSGATVFTYTVTRSSTSGAVNVPWSFTPGGTAASDFTSGSLPAGGTVAMADGVATGTFSISVNGDITVEAEETFTVLLSTPSGYVAGASMSATGTILNDDAVSIMPMRTIAVQNRTHTGKESRATADRCSVRWPLIVGQDASEAALWFSNWVHGTAPGPNGAAIEVLGASLQLDGASTTVPVTFGGARNLAMADGANDILSDAIPASAFGLSKFTTGETYWVKAVLAFATGATVPNSQRAVSNLSGSQAAFFASANTTITSVDAPGVATATGTALDGRANGYCPMLMGRPIVDGPSFIGIGDSIMEVTGDSGGDTSKEFGLAFFQRAMHDASTARTSLRPSILLARVGIAASAVSTSELWKPLLKYVRYAVEELGTNDMGTGGNAVLSDIQTRLQSIWTACVAAGVKIYRTNYIARSSSTNSFTDKAGQTPSPGWAAGQTRDQLIAWFDTKVADGTLQGVIDTLSVATDPTDNHYFLTTGVASATTSDGTHPRDFIHELMAAKVRAVIQPSNSREGQQRCLPIPRRGSARLCAQPLKP